MQIRNSEVDLQFPYILVAFPGDCIDHRHHALPFEDFLEMKLIGVLWKSKNDYITFPGTFQKEAL